MRLKIKFRPHPDQEKIIVPIHYQSLLQGIIYHSLDEDPAFQKFVHNRGFINDRRKFKLFTFSRLFGHAYYDRQTHQLIFHDTVFWYVGSVLPQLIHSLGDRLLLSDGIRLGNQIVMIDSVAYEKLPQFKTNVLSIQMLSPIVVYSTIEKTDGGRLTHFFGPHDEAFRQLVLKNCLRKYEAYYGEPYQDELDFHPLRVVRGDKVVTAYRETIINAWNGTYRLRANRKMLNFLYEAGIAGKNSQGFGMFTVVAGGGELHAHGVGH